MRNIFFPHYLSGEPFLFLLAAFCSLFHDIVRHACKIQQKGAQYKAIIQTES